MVKFNCETLYLKLVSCVFNVNIMFLSADPPLPTITPPPTPTPPPLPTTTIPDRNLMYFYGNNWVMYDLRYVRSQMAHVWSQVGHVRSQVCTILDGSCLISSWSCTISGVYDLRWVMSNVSLQYQVGHVRSQVSNLRWVMYNLRPKGFYITFTFTFMQL